MFLFFFHKYTYHKLHVAKNTTHSSYVNFAAAYVLVVNSAKTIMLIRSCGEESELYDTELGINSHFSDRRF